MAGLVCARSANRYRAFGPYPSLPLSRRRWRRPNAIVYASNQLIHDLAVWYHLAWLGETVRRADPVATALTTQGRGFTEAQRRELLALVAEPNQCRGAALSTPRERGQCELSVTPYGHPIVPLLLDFQSARERFRRCRCRSTQAMPADPSGQPGMSKKACAFFMRAFGVRPAGCWPSEGAISRGTLECSIVPGSSGCQQHKCAAGQSVAEECPGGIGPPGLQPALSVAWHLDERFFSR